MEYILKTFVAGLLAGLIIALALFFTFKKNVCNCPEYDEVERRVDTVWVDNIIDPTPEPVAIDSLPIPKPTNVRPAPKHDTINDTVKIVTPCDSIRTYDYAHTDSLVEISFQTEVQGLLLNQKLSYRIKPITTRIPVITETITLRENARGVYLTGGLDFSSDIYEPKLMVGGLYNTGKWLFGASYVLKDKAVLVHTGYRIF